MRDLFRGGIWNLCIFNQWNSVFLNNTSNKWMHKAGDCLLKINNCVAFCAEWNVGGRTWVCCDALHLEELLQSHSPGNSQRCHPTTHTNTWRPPFISSVCFYSESTQLHTFTPAITMCLVIWWESVTDFPPLIKAATSHPPPYSLYWLYLQTQCCSAEMKPLSTCQYFATCAFWTKHVNLGMILQLLTLIIAPLQISDHMSALETMVIKKRPMRK